MMDAEDAKVAAAAGLANALSPSVVSRGTLHSQKQDAQHRLLTPCQCQMLVYVED